MSIRSFLGLPVAIFSITLMVPSPSLSFEHTGLTDGLENATVSVLSKLGYDCQTASIGGIVCKKCSAEDDKQKCEAYLCDAVTKKCRKKQAEVPQLPNLNGNDEEDSSDEINLPSL